MSTTLFVVDDSSVFAESGLNTLSFESYLREYPKLNEPKIRVINLCDTERYLSEGYYCSLLAEARQHEVLPNVRVINTLRITASKGLVLGAHAFGKSFQWPSEKHQTLICMGEVADSNYKKVADSLFQQYPSPLLLLTLTPSDHGVDVNLHHCALSELNQDQQAFCIQVLSKYATQRWRKQGSGKKLRWDLAILVNPEEAVPPSNKSAISRFVKAAEKLGIHAEVLSSKALLNVNNYDGLFLRETTAIDHHTYRLACQAEENNLVVLDDPSSILRCCNKVFLHDAFNYKKVPSLKTIFISHYSHNAIEEVEANFSYPVVLKLPEGSFSRGVYKAENRDELAQHLTTLFAESALILAQEYLYTEYDWRIGVLNGRAIYACRYFMARNHWQIYNHKSKRNFSGGFETLPTFEVPRVVLDAALKASAVVGNGIYGVDIKELDNRAYVIEVNDNPSIDHGIEDHYLGEELYMQIMSEFLRRFEMRGR